MEIVEINILFENVSVGENKWKKIKTIFKNSESALQLYLQLKICLHCESGAFGRASPSWEKVVGGSQALSRVSMGEAREPPLSNEPNVPCKRSRAVKKC